MSVTSPGKRTEIPEEILTRLRRQLLGVVTILLAAGAGWLGIIMRPYLGPIVLTVAVVALIWLVVVSAIDFFLDR